MKQSPVGEQPFTFFFRSRNPLSGFTLLELVVVISLIAVLVALALPPTLRARVQSNESAAMGNLRTVSSSAESFRTTTDPPAYPASFNAMITSNPPYLDVTWGNNQRQGYNYTYTASADGATYAVAATPQIANVSGINSYCVDQSGVIRRYAPGQAGAIGNQSGCGANGVPI